MLKFHCFRNFMILKKQVARKKFGGFAKDHERNLWTEFHFLSGYPLYFQEILIAIKCKDLLFPLRVHLQQR